MFFVLTLCKNYSNIYSICLKWIRKSKVSIYTKQTHVLQWQKKNYSNYLIKKCVQWVSYNDAPNNVMFYLNK